MLLYGCYFNKYYVLISHHNTPPRPFHTCAATGAPGGLRWLEVLCCVVSVEKREETNATAIGGGPACSEGGIAEIMPGKEAR